MNLTQGMVVAGIAAAETIDKTGERIKIKGIDITSMVSGQASVNVEHAQQGKDSFGEETIGRVVYAKKILKRDDCDNVVQEDFWDDLECPYLFVLIRLYDAAGHTNAKAHAAQIRDAQANGETQQVALSIEGVTTERDGTTLKETIARKVSMTLGPCNSACKIVLVADPQAPEGFAKQPVPWSDLAGCTIFKGEEKDPEPVESLARFQKAEETINKALTASGMGSPDSLSNGAALAKEHLRGLTATYRGKKDRDSIKRWLKERKPTASDEDLEKAADEYENMGKTAQELYWGLQSTLIDLFKAVPDRRVEFCGNWVDPGALVCSDGIYAILHVDEAFYYIVPQGKEETYDLPDLQKVPKIQEDKFYTVTCLPSTPIGLPAIGGPVLKAERVDVIPGGLADKKSPEDFDPVALKEGITEELEHTSDPRIALEIAMDHLTEDSNYYRKLRAARL